MRFLFCDRIVEIEPGRRALGRKVIPLDGIYFNEHFSRRAVMPASLLIESLAQLAGWLNFASNGEGIRMVVALVEEVEVHGDVAPGDALDLEIWVVHAHAGGLTVRGEIRLGERMVATVGRMVFANEQVAADGFTSEEREHQHYLQSRVPPPRGPR